MKLYSHTQLIRTTLICVVAAVLLTAAIFVNISKKKSETASQVVSESAATETSEVALSTAITNTVEDSVLMRFAMKR